MAKKKNKNILLVIVNVLFLIAIAELSRVVLQSVSPINAIAFTPIIFLAVKISHDIYSYLVYDEEIFSYIEEFIKEVFLILVISVAAGGIAFLTEMIIKGSVRTTVFAVIASLYLKKK